MLFRSACARAIVEEVAKRPGVESAKADFEKSQLVIKVKPGGSLTVDALRKLLKKAARRVNLGTEFEIKRVAYPL